MLCRVLCIVLKLLFFFFIDVASWFDRYYITYIVTDVVYMFRGNIIDDVSCSLKVIKVVSMFLSNKTHVSCSWYERILDALCNKDTTFGLHLTTDVPLTPAEASKHIITRGSLALRDSKANKTSSLPCVWGRVSSSPAVYCLQLMIIWWLSRPIHQPTITEAVQGLLSGCL